MTAHHDQDPHHSSTKEPQPQLELGPSLLFIYFMIGFVLGAVLSMVALTMLRPMLPLEALWVRWLVVSPLVIGGFLGGRVARIGARERASLSHALLRALGLRRA